MSIVATLDTASSACCFVFYLVRCIAQSLVSNTSGTDDRWWRSSRKDKAKPKRGKKSLANWIQVVGTSSVFVLSLARAYLAFLSKSSSRPEDASGSDADVVSLLFSTLTWLLFFLGTIDTVEVVGSEQYVPWMISLVVYSVTTALSSAQHHHRRYYSANVGVQWARLSVLLILVLTAAFSKRTSKNAAQATEAPAEETQPLLQEETPKNDDDDNESIATNESTESEIARDDKEDTDRAALRDRSWLQYVSSFRIFIPFIRPRTWRQHFYLGITVLNTLAARLVTLGLPLTLGSLVDDLVKHRFSLSKVFLYVGLRFAGSPSGLSLIRAIVSYRLQTEMHAALTRHCYNHIMELSADFHLNKSTPATWQILERGNSVVTLLQDVFFRILPVIADLFIALFFVTKMFGAYLCFAVATTMILLSWVNRVTLTKKTEMRRKYLSIWSDYYTHMTDSFMHWKTVSEFNQIGHEKDRHAKKNQASTERQIKNRSFRIWLDAVQEVVVTTGFLVVCLIAAREIVARRADPGSFVTLITFWAQIMNPVTTLAGSASDISEQLVDAEKLMVLLERKPAIKENTDAPPFEFKGGDVSFEDVVFSYDGERIVTQNVSFQAKAGETIALVGETGGGKSTLFNLLYRFFDPRSGRILVDGQDIKQVQLVSFRDILGLVPQNPVLFNTSVFRNVKYSNLNATEEQVIEACKAAQLHDKIEKFPKKYKQKVGEQAQKLSGGELQRLAIARAILKDPKILLLDEATSAVDSVTETKIQMALQKLCKGRTTFIIAHRLSTIMGADRILVIKGGEVKECGKHEDLLKNPDGAYSELWGAQLKLAKGMREKKERKDKGEAISEDETAVDETLLLFDDMGAQFGEDGQTELAKLLGPKEVSDESRTLSVNSGEDRAKDLKTPEPPSSQSGEGELKAKEYDPEPDAYGDGKVKEDDGPKQDEHDDSKRKV